MKHLITGAAFALAMAVASSASAQSGPWSDTSRWVPLGESTFTFKGGDDTVAGAGGRHIRTLAVRPRHSDAQCSRMVIRFASGERSTLPVNNGQIMRRRQFYPIDLPGHRRSIARLALSCCAVGNRLVSVEVYANR